MEIAEITIHTKSRFAESEPIYVLVDIDSENYKRIIQQLRLDSQQIVKQLQREG